MLTHAPPQTAQHRPFMVAACMRITKYAEHHHKNEVDDC